MKFWDPEAKTSEKGIFGDKGEISSFAAGAYDENGVLYAGGANGQVYVWKDGRNLDSTVKVHESGFISAMRYYSGKLFTGGKDGNIYVLDVDSNLSVTKKIVAGATVRGIDGAWSAEFVVAGMQNGVVC